MLEKLFVSTPTMMNDHYISQLHPIVTFSLGASRPVVQVDLWNLSRMAQAMHM